MAATVKVRLGDLFDGPSDLVVLPCSTGGSVTGFVARSLSNHSIPHPQGRMKLGDVEIMPFEGGEDIAQFVAFAASVKSYTSSPHAVQSIGAVNGPDREVIFRLRRAGRLRGYGDSAFNCPLKHCGWLAISGR